MILIFLADGFEEVEALAVVDILRRANLNVSMVGVTGSWVKGAHGIRVECDTEIEKLKPSEDIEAVIPAEWPVQPTLISHRLWKVLSAMPMNTANWSAQSVLRLLFLQGWASLMDVMRSVTPALKNT